MNKVEKTPLPEFLTDDEAERFVDEADLSQFDLRTNRRTMRFEIGSNEAPRTAVVLDPDGGFRIRLTEANGKLITLPERYADQEAADAAAAELENSSRLRTAASK